VGQGGHLCAVLDLFDPALDIEARGLPTAPDARPAALGEQRKRERRGGVGRHRSEIHEPFGRQRALPCHGGWRRG
jgi:hypothetical protein